MATRKKPAPKKVAPKNPAPKKATTPIQDPLIQHHVIPISEAPQFIQDLFRPGKSASIPMCDCPKSKVERIMDILEGTDQIEVNNIFIDVQTKLRRIREDRIIALRREIDKIKDSI